MAWDFTCRVSSQPGRLGYGVESRAGYTTDPAYRPPRARPKLAISGYMLGATLLRVPRRWARRPEGGGSSAALGQRGSLHLALSEPLTSRVSRAPQQKTPRPDPAGAPARRAATRLSVIPTGSLPVAHRQARDSVMCRRGPSAIGAYTDCLIVVRRTTEPVTS
jgi:hypothetical protein